MGPSGKSQDKELSINFSPMSKELDKGVSESTGMEFLEFKTTWNFIIFYCNYWWKAKTDDYDFYIYLTHIAAYLVV